MPRDSRRRIEYAAPWPGPDSPLATASPLHHSLILVPHGVRNGEQIGLVVGVVVVVEEEGDDARRRGAQKRFLDLDRSQRRLHVFDVDGRRPRVSHADRAVAARGAASRTARITEDAPGQLWEVRQVLVLQRLADAAEAVQAVFDVRRVARLADLTVIDDVESCRRLLIDHRRHCGADARRQRGLVDRHALFPGEHHPDQVIRPRQAASVRGQKTPLAAFHRSLSRCEGAEGRVRRPHGAASTPAFLKCTAAGSAVRPQSRNGHKWVFS